MPETINYYKATYEGVERSVSITTLDGSNGLSVWPNLHDIQSSELVSIDKTEHSTLVSMIDLVVAEAPAMPPV